MAKGGGKGGGRQGSDAPAKPGKGNPASPRHGGGKKGGK